MQRHNWCWGTTERSRLYKSIYTWIGCKGMNTVLHVTIKVLYMDSNDDVGFLMAQILPEWCRYSNMEVSECSVWKKCENPSAILQKVLLKDFILEFGNLVETEWLVTFHLYRHPSYYYFSFIACQYQLAHNLCIRFSFFKVFLYLL